MAKVTGIGGVFFKALGPEALKEWYAKHLGLEIAEWGGVVFLWDHDKQVQSAQGLTVWHLADADGDWFEPSKSQVPEGNKIELWEPKDPA